MNYCSKIKSAIDGADRPDVLPYEAASHVTACPACRSFADERAKLRELMASAARVSVPVNFDAVLNERLSRVKSQKSSWLSPAGYLRVGTATAGVLLAVLAAQYGGLFESAQKKTAEQQAAAPPAVSVAQLNVPTGGAIENSDPTPSQPIGATGPKSVSFKNQTPRATRETPTPPRDPQFIIVRDRNREVEVPMMPVSLGMQQQVLNSWAGNSHVIRTFHTDGSHHSRPTLH